MDLNAIKDSILEALNQQLPGILGALAALVLGWIVALLVRAVVRRGLGILKLNERIESATGTQIDVQGRGQGSVLGHPVLGAHRVLQHHEHGAGVGAVAVTGG